MARARSQGLSRLLAKSGQPVFATDDERRIVFFNDAAAAWSGYTADEMVGLECHYHSSPEVEGPAALACALCPAPEVMLGNNVKGAMACRSRDGKPLRAEVRYVPLRGDQVGVLGVLGVVTPLPDSQANDKEDPQTENAVRQLHARIQRLRQQYRERYHVDQLLGATPAVERARAQAALAAQSLVSVVMVGPPGSGREHLARAIHYSQSGDDAPPLVPLACPLVGSELLTSTVAALARGLAPAASRKATLLLNDVDQLAPSLQATLPALLKSAAEKTRIVSTSQQSLVALAANGRFDRALAHSLSTLCIELPALRERLEDLPLLAQLFLEQCNALGGKQLGRFTEEALDLLAGYPWQGNLDELQQFVRQAHERASGLEITVEDLPPALHYARDAAAQPRRQEETIVLDTFLAGIERELVERALTQAKGNKSKAAQLLGMTRPKLYRRMVQLGLIEAGDQESDAASAASDLAPMDAFHEEGDMFVEE